MASVFSIGAARQRIGDLATAVGLFTPAFGMHDHEVVWAAHLDRGMRLLSLDRVAEGDGRHTILPLRMLIGDALALDARGLILAHNHPQGDPRPSRADILVTRQIVEIARPLGLRLIDHLVFAPGTVTSFRALGLL